MDKQSLSRMNETWGNNGRWLCRDPGLPLLYIHADFLSATTKGIAPRHRGGSKCQLSQSRIYKKKKKSQGQSLKW